MEMKIRKIKKTGMVEKQGIAGIIADIIIVLLLLLTIFICFMPLWHILMASVSDGLSLLSNKSLLFLPIGKFTLAGYNHIFKDMTILTGYRNTLIYVISSTLLGLILNVLGGYIMSRKTKLRSPMILFVLFTMMFSGGLIPTYMVLKSLGMVGSMSAIIIPGCTNAMFMILAMNAFAGVPESTVEAARIDGAGHLRVMFQVMLPQSMSMITVIILYSVVAQWNSWFPASVYLVNQRELWPIQLFIREITSDNRGFLQNQNPDYSRYLIQYALIILGTVPILALFPLFMKYIEKGILLGAVKE